MPVDADTILKTHRRTLRHWAGLVRQKYPLAYDEAYNEVCKGFIEAAGRWRPDGGAKLLNFARRRAFGAAIDYWKSTLWTTENSGVWVKVVAELPDDGEPSSMPTAGLQSPEFWAKVHGVLYTRHRMLWLFLCLLYRERWTSRQIAKYFQTSEVTVFKYRWQALSLLAKSDSLGRYIRDEPRNDPRKPRRKARHAFDIPIQPRCCMLGCSSPVEARGKCMLHYYRDRRAMKAEPGKPSRNTRIGTFACACGQPAGSCKVCRKCYQRLDAKRRRDRKRKASA